jgi:hypothetical protein
MKDTNWINQFGAAYAVPVEITKHPRLLHDTSWGNDTTPSFHFPSGGGGIRLWVDHPNPEEREVPENKRFGAALYTLDDGEIGEYVRDLFETDDLALALEYLEFHMTPAAPVTIPMVPFASGKRLLINPQEVDADGVYVVPGRGEVNVDTDAIVTVVCPDTLWSYDVRPDGKFHVLIIREEYERETEAEIIAVIRAEYSE